MVVEHNEITRAQRWLITAVAGVMWYFANHLSGDYGWLLWVAPLPLLALALRSTARATFWFVFLAYLIGRLSWLSYLLLLVPLPLAIAFTVVLPLVYAWIMLGFRRAALSGRPWLALLSYPALLTAFDFVWSLVSADGTAASLAYTQVNYLPVIQIASVTGVYGIVFITALIPATLVVAWHFRRAATPVVLAGSVLVIGTHIFGWIRLGDQAPYATVPVGITVVEEQLHYAKTTDIAATQKLRAAYRANIAALARQGAYVVLFPEKAIEIPVDQKDSLLQWMRHAARDLDISVAGGITVNKPSSRQNLVDFVTPDGKVQEYRKVYHVTGWEDGFEPGDKPVHLQGMPTGMAICKDMDFPQWLRNYSQDDLMLVPAWDFRVDGWLHGRMAVLRGVENGFTLVRAARQGRLSVSDPWGRVLNEVSCENNQPASLLAQVPIYHIDTLYGRFGDWFGWMCGLLAGAIVIYTRFNSRFKVQGPKIDVKP
jgi:apolipoprotein N-acyltransferase